MHAPGASAVASETQVDGVLVDGARSPEKACYKGKPLATVSK